MSSTTLAIAGFVTLTKDLARSIKRGHPWLYRDALSGSGDLQDGQYVSVHTPAGKELARGFWDSRSSIAVRIVEKEPPFAHPDDIVQARLRDALRRRLEDLDLRDTNAFRWVHGEADRLPGIHIDYYAGAIAVRFDGSGARAFYESLPEQVHQAGRELLPIHAVVDRDKPAPIPERLVLEAGASFYVDLLRGQKGGLFLDQRENRLRVAALSSGKSVLNLFGYTGGFSVHAALAGASRTDTVDIAAPALDAAKRNFELNGLDASKAGFHAQDAFEFLEQAANRGRRWDIVVSDPPSFAARKSLVPKALGAYTRLHRLAASVTTRGGILCAASCSSHVGGADFLRTVEEGAKQAGRRWKLTTLHGAAFDHPVIPSFPEGDYLKFAIGTVT